MDTLCENGTNQAIFNNLIKNCYQLLDEWGEKSALHDAIAQQYQPQKNVAAIRKWFSGSDLNIPDNEYARLTVATCMIEALHQKLTAIEEGKIQMHNLFNELNTLIYEKVPTQAHTGNVAPCEM